MDRPIDMALGGEIDDGARTVLRKQRVDLRAVADVAANEYVPHIAAQPREATEIAGVSELVQVDDGLPRALQPIEHEVGADKSGTAGDKNHGSKWADSRRATLVRASARRRR